MEHFDHGLLPPSEKPTTAHPPSLLPELAQFDPEYIKYCIEQEQTVSEMERKLHESDDPQEIGIMALRTACDFYAADWAGIIKVDLELGIASHGWWYNPDPKINTLQRMYEYENF